MEALFVCRQWCLLLDLFQYQQTKEANWTRTRTRRGGFAPYLLQIVTKLLCSEKREHPARKHLHSACWVAQGSLMAADLVCRSTESHSLFHCADLVHYPIPLPPTLPRILPLLPHTSQFLFHCCCLWETTLSAPHRSSSNYPCSLPLPCPQWVVLLLLAPPLALCFCLLQILGRVWVMIIWPIPITRRGKKKKNPMREEKKKKGFFSCILSYFLLLLPVLGFEFCLLWIFVDLEEGTRRHQNFFSWSRFYISSASFCSLTSLLLSVKWFCISQILQRRLWAMSRMILWRNNSFCKHHFILLCFCWFFILVGFFRVCGRFCLLFLSLGFVERSLSHVCCWRERGHLEILENAHRETERDWVGTYYLVGSSSRCTQFQILGFEEKGQSRRQEDGHDRSCSGHSRACSCICSSEFGCCSFTIPP